MYYYLANEDALTDMVHIPMTTTCYSKQKQV